MVGLKKIKILKILFILTILILISIPSIFLLKGYDFKYYDSYNATVIKKRQECFKSKCNYFLLVKLDETKYYETFQVEVNEEKYQFTNIGSNVLVIKLKNK